MAPQRHQLSPASGPLHRLFLPPGTLFPSLHMLCTQASASTEASPSVPMLTVTEPSRPSVIIRGHNEMLEDGLGAQTWGSVPQPPHTAWASLGPSPSHLEPQSPHLSNADTARNLTGHPGRSKGDYTADSPSVTPTLALVSAMCPRGQSLGDRSRAPTRKWTSSAQLHFWPRVNTF